MTGKKKLDKGEKARISKSSYDLSQRKTRLIQIEEKVLAGILPDEVVVVKDRKLQAHKIDPKDRVYISNTEKPKDDMSSKERGKVTKKRIDDYYENRVKANF